jgi:hypothetical protein
MDSSQLVLGVATSLPASHFQPFFRSLRNSGYRGVTGLIIGDYAPDEAKELAALADVTWNLDEERPTDGNRDIVLRALRFMQKQRGLRRLYPGAFQLATRVTSERKSQDRWELLERELQGLQGLRYGLYHEFLYRFAPEAQTILLSDLRDVVFQGDPFADPVDSLELFLEDERTRISDEEFNSRWLKDLYGADVLRQLERYPVSCSGTVAGSRAGVLRYLHLMDRSLISRRRVLGPHDQGVHNYLLRTGKFPGSSIKSNGQGRVLTMGRMQEPAVTNGRVDLNGFVPPVLHQYDRFPMMAGQLACLQD